MTQGQHRVVDVYHYHPKPQVARGIDLFAHALDGLSRLPAAFL
ncbi:MAG TPA: hypothetical protein VMH28_02350 [Candidatus Acidoferrales bacterium]|nr:hypothetical protein [Candidatus Acidoferrales bacterium]